MLRQRELDRAALARTSERLGLLGLQLERGGFADQRVAAFFFLRRLVDGEDTDIGQDDFRTDDVRRLAVRVLFALGEHTSTRSLAG